MVGTLLVVGMQLYMLRAVGTRWRQWWLTAGTGNGGPRGNWLRSSGLCRGIKPRGRAGLRLGYGR